MGFVAILSLLEHSSIGLERFASGDHIPGWGASGIAVRRTPGGVRFNASGFTLDAGIGSDGISPVWATLSVYISDSITGAEVESLNKITRGTGFPRVETNWRTKALSLNLPGQRVPLPVLAEAALTPTGKTVHPVRILKAGGKVTPKAPTSPIAVAGITAARASLTSTPPAPATVGGEARRALTPNAAPVAVRAPISPVKPEVVSTPLKAERIAPVSDPTGVFMWPTSGSGIWTKPGVEAELDIIWKMHLAGDRQVIALKGPAGTGKTSLAYDIAARAGAPVAKIDGAGAVTFADWVGSTGATERNGATVTEFQPSGFLQAVRADGPMAGIPRIVLLDEVNRSESAGALNALIPCLDHLGSLYVADARRSIPLDPAVLYIMTANMGATYTGTIALDQALKDRVTHWETMGYPEESVEVRIVTERTGLDAGLALQLVRAAAQVRDVAARGEIEEGIGPRRVLVAARKIKAGFGPRRACISAWSGSYSDEGGSTSEAAIVTSRIEAAFRS